MIEFNVKKSKLLRNELLELGCLQVGRGKFYDNFQTENKEHIPNEARIMANPKTVKKLFKKSWLGQMFVEDVNSHGRGEGVNLQWIENNPLWISGKQFKSISNFKTPKMIN